MPSFQRNARDFSNYLSALFTRTITPHEPLRYSIPGRNQALIAFRNRYAVLDNGSIIRIFHTIGPNPQQKHKVTTLEYSYTFILGSDPDAEPFVRYDYVPQEAEDLAYRYPAGHVHIDATAAH